MWPHFRVFVQFSTTIKGSSSLGWHCRWKPNRVSGIWIFYPETPSLIFLYLLTRFLCFLGILNHMNRYRKHIICNQKLFFFFILTDDFVFFFGSSDIEWHWIGVFVFIYALIKSGRTNPFSEKWITCLSTWFNFLSAEIGTVYIHK